MDIKNGKGDPVYSMISGTVVEAKSNCPIGSNITCNGKLGNRIAIKSTNGVIIRYSHLGQNLKFKVGDPVNIGDVVGYSAESGNIINTQGEFHVHIEAFINSLTISSRHNPVTYFGTTFNSNGTIISDPSC